MSQKPIFVATHPRACSTAFERVFMTRRDTIQCIHEPFGDAFYYGPERLSARFADDEQARLESGFSQSTFQTVLARIEREASEGKRIFMKDIMHYLLPPYGKPASIAPSLNRIKRGVGTESNGETAPLSAVGANGTNGHHAQQLNGTSPVQNGTKNGLNGHAVLDHSTPVKPATTREPYPYDTAAEPGNPTVMPTEILSQFHFAFLIRDPHHSVPSYFRCTIPPLDQVTGFHNYDPSEAGYDELRRTFDYLRSVRLVGPHIATQERDADDIDNKLRPVTNGLNGYESGAEICVVDADDMLQKPAAMIEAFCRSVGIEYTPDMLCWDTEEDHQVARDKFEKWRGFHNDAIESKGLVARKHPHAVKTEEEWDAEWRKKYGPEAADLIRQTVDANMADYLYLKQFAMRV
ncbi:hypothetical protein AtubIFM55763_003073 [Aspergillus tubingensis]|uniref:P-loop containing nucleoside triphosphate hydrolase protein n=2 Tax=Aspergillus subgen. Circumdati TaxID=2720871 RepID=A0A100I791_ASPNG|nr:uncharacterized protein AtWU_04041 [Aspergillus tubingensis]GAQ35968.1 hypothetical protein ABL_01418 [Aspergillus niger]GFN14241.1 hypothetical protein AtWU_04041 [Aspergillus tubingensis]GLA64002.1 hypothetical protein AtubIFM54640_005169 [Aspergillus tubingensis]GLA72532.1 hypothetical protein AtubIFM55763_003073 [Aspergillus tubingensis]GLA88599.1 hypothetical protein AtubIFM56815_003057 [Aspergillus tubingensis]